MNTQVLELNDHDLQIIQGGGAIGELTDTMIGVVPAVGIANRFASLGGFSIGKLVERLF